MKIAVLFASREGQTRRVAEHLAAALRARGAEAEARDVAGPARALPLDGYAAVVLAAPVHYGRHERALADFVTARRDALARLPNAFVSVSLSQAGVERPTSSPDRRARSAAEVARALAAFTRETGWQPERVWPVAGALAYTKYRPLVRWLMKWIARRVGSTTDTTRDHDFTDWSALDRYADELFDAARAHGADAR